MVELLPWLKAFHVVAVIAWMAAILYIFRLYIYHAAETEEIVKERLTKWELLLHERIGRPAMIVTIVLGIAMLWIQPSLLQQPFMQVKLAGVVGLMGVYGYGSTLRRKLVAGEPVPSDRALRILNEVPTVFMILIVVMVIVRPWIR